MRDVTGVTVVVEKACRGACGRILPATDVHFYRDRGKLRGACRDCMAGADRQRTKERNASPRRVCHYCRVSKRKADFATSVHGGRTRYAENCLACEANIRHPDPMAEAERDFRSGIQNGQRWAITLSILLGRRRMTLADYKALKGEALRAFEARWSALMRELARDLGEWLPEWDNPAHIPSTRHEAHTRNVPGMGVAA